MTLTRDDLPRSLFAAIRDLWLNRRARRDERLALEVISAKPDTHWLEDAGLTRDDAARMMEEQRLHRIAEWSRWRGRGL